MPQFQRNIRIIFAVRIFGSLHFDRAIFILYLLHSGLTHGEIASLQIIIFLSIMIMEVPSGIFADAYGRKGAMAMGAALLGLYAIGMIFTQDFWLFFILFVVEGAGFAFYSGSETAMLYDTLKALRREEKFVEYNSRLMMIGGLALGLGVGLGGFLQEWGGWKLVYLTYFATIFVSLILTAWLVEPPFDEAHAEKSHESYGQKIGEFRAILREPALRPIFYFILAIGLFDGMIVPLYIYSQELLAERGLQIHQISLVYGAVEIAASLSFLLAPFFLRTMGAKRVLQAAIAISGICAALFVINNAALTVALMLIMFSLPEARRPIQENYFNARIPSHVRASLISFDSMIGSVLVACVYLYYGFMQNVLGLGSVIALSALACALSLVVLNIYFRNEIPEEN